jgi:hypothetical protein
MAREELALPTPARVTAGRSGTNSDTAWRRGRNKSDAECSKLNQ